MSDPTLRLILVIVLSFCAYTLAVFLLPSSADDDRRLDPDDLPDDEFWNRVDEDGRFT